MNCITVDNIGFQYDRKYPEVLKDISFSLSRNNTTALIGANGAGKTTLLKILCGQLHPSAGTQSINEVQIRKPFQLLHDFKIGYCPEIVALDPDLTAEDTLELVGKLRKVIPAEQEKEISMFIKIFDMSEWFHSTLTKHYSMGMQKKLALSIALLGPIQYAILDEPFNGLDPLSSFGFKQLLKDKKDAGCGILISSHLLDTVEKLCDSILLLYQGRMIYGGTLSDLKNKYRHCGDLESIYFTILQGNNEKNI